MDCDDWTTTDKGLHFGAGFIAGAAAETALDYIWPESNKLERAVVALIPVVVLAVAKEVADKQDPDNHSCDARDAVATVAGGVLAISLTLRF